MPETPLCASLTRSSTLRLPPTHPEYRKIAHGNDGSRNKFPSNYGNLAGPALGSGGASDTYSDETSIERAFRMFYTGLFGVRIRIHESIFVE